MLRRVNYKLLYSITFWASGLLSSLVVVAQNLEEIAPILKTYSIQQKKWPCFLLTATDYRKSVPAKARKCYSDCVQVVDADQSWPPRWYAYVSKRNLDSAKIMNKRIKSFEDLIIDARYQNGYLTFYKQRATIVPKDKKIEEAEYIICDKKLNPIDSLKGLDNPISFHDFRLGKNGQRMVMVILDTVLDFRDVSNNIKDSAVKTEVDVIEIFDRDNKLIHRFNSADFLGACAYYYPYHTYYNISAKAGYIDWSHGNSLNWDFDGNILYSFRQIGIGKISAKTGKVIWRMDRGDMPFLVGKDTIAFYLQHGFDRYRHNPFYTTYTVYNDGDRWHTTESSYGLQFKVKNKNNALHLVKKKQLQWSELTKDIHSKYICGQGNYEIDNNGDYLIDYGYCDIKNNRDTSKYREFLEYGDKNDRLYAKYCCPLTVSAYKTHLLENWKPPRPQIITNENGFQASGRMTDWVWYELSGYNNEIVTKVGEGATFDPDSPGNYCVVGKYGIGYDVSLPVQYTCE